MTWLSCVKAVRQSYYGGLPNGTDVRMIQHTQDTAQERKKQQLVKLMRELIEQVESNEQYGEFGVTFSTQAGKIGHYEVHRRETYK